MRKLLVLVALFAACISAFAQNPHLKFDHFTVQDGLPERQIQFIKQDDQGYVWVGTQNGLLRYDGYKSKVYRFGVDKDAVFQSCSVRSAILDKDRNLWVSTLGNGLFRYDRSKDIFVQYKYPQNNTNKGFYDQFLTTSDKNVNLWLIEFRAINNQNKSQVVRFDPKTGNFDVFGDEQKGVRNLDAKDNYDLLKAADGTMWLGTSSGLFRYDDKGDRFHRQPISTDTTTRDTIYNVYEAPSEKGILWLSGMKKNSRQALYPAL